MSSALQEVIKKRDGMWVEAHLGILLIENSVETQEYEQTAATGRKL